MRNTVDHSQAATPSQRSGGEVKMILAGVFFGVIGGEAFIVQPGFVQGMTNYLGLTDQQAGYAASAEMFGFAVATISLIFLAPRVNARAAVTVSLLLMVAGNVAALFASTFEPFSVSRFVAGLGGGSVVSFGFASLGMTSKPDRNFAYMVMSAMIFGAIILYSMPTMYAQFGMPSVLILFSVCAGVGLLFVSGIPVSSRQQAQVETDSVDLGWRLRIMALFAMLSYFLAQGGVWAYLALIGESQEMSEQGVADALTASQLSGLAGAFVVSVLGARFGRLAPLSVAAACGVAPLLWFVFGSSGAAPYLVAVLIYNFGFNMAHPYLLATMASFDRRGRVVVYAVAMQTLGLAIGPAIAARLVGDNGYENVNWFGIVFFCACIALIAPPALAQARLARSGEANVRRT